MKKLPSLPLFSKDFLILFFAILSIFFSTPWWVPSLLTSDNIDTTESTSMSGTPTTTGSTLVSDIPTTSSPISNRGEPAQSKSCVTEEEHVVVYDKERDTLRVEKHDTNRESILTLTGDYVLWQAETSSDGRFIFFELRAGPSCERDEGVAYRFDIVHGVVSRIFGTADLWGLHPFLWSVSPDGSRAAYGLYPCFACEASTDKFIVVKVSEAVVNGLSPSVAKNLGARVAYFIFTGNSSFTYYHSLPYYGEDELGDDPNIPVRRYEGPYSDNF